VIIEISISVIRYSAHAAIRSATASGASMCGKTMDKIE
jgi:hypothetical protein